MKPHAGMCPPAGWLILFALEGQWKRPLLQELQEHWLHVSSLDDEMSYLCKSTHSTAMCYSCAYVRSIFSGDPNKHFASHL